MTPPMYERVRNYFDEAGLLSGFTPQILIWSDSGDLSEAFIIFRPNGGTAIKHGLGSDRYVTVDVIGAKGKNAVTALAVESIIDYVQQNPMADNCVGYLENLGGVPTPIPTDEGRLVFRLQFVATFGD